MSHGSQKMLAGFVWQLIYSQLEDKGWRGFERRVEKNVVAPLCVAIKIIESHNHDFSLNLQTSAAAIATDTVLLLIERNHQAHPSVGYKTTTTTRRWQRQSVVDKFALLFVLQQQAQIKLGNWLSTMLYIAHETSTDETFSFINLISIS